MKYIRNPGLHSQSKLFAAVPGHLLWSSVSVDGVEGGSSSCVNATVDPGITITPRPSPASMSKSEFFAGIEL
jgi:hypothetical protein